MSPDFEKLKKQYELRYVTIDQLRRWVAIHDKNPNRGISAEEFKLITGTDY